MKTNHILSTIKRRSFLKIFSLAGAGSLFFTKDLMSKTFSTNALSRVVIIGNTQASKGQKVNSVVVNSMINNGVLNYTGLSDIGESWKTILEGIKESDKIAIKVNCTEYSALGVPFSLTKAVIDGLTQMDFSGTKFPENNIIIYEFPYRGAGFSKHGYTVNTTNKGVQCYTVSKYSTNNYDVAGVEQKLATLITEDVKYIINIAILQDHYDAGISLCMKNHFGTINTPSACHGAKINEHIAALNALEPIKSKQKFCIIDAILGATNSGAAYGVINCAPNKIIMGQDIVAVDYQGKKMLEEYGTIKASLDRSTCIDIAANTYLLGTNDPEKMEILNITDTTSEIQSTKDQSYQFHNSPNPFNLKTTFHFTIRETSIVQIRILNLNGVIVATIIDRKLEPGNYDFTWNTPHSVIHEGIYLAEMKTDQNIQSILIQKS